MSANEKVYVIDPNPKWKVRGKSSVLYSPDESSSAGESPYAGLRGSDAESLERLDRLDEKGSPALAFIAYLAGPLSILATRRGRRSRFWVSVAALSCSVAAVLIGLRAGGVLPQPAQSFGAGSLAWLLAACLVTLAGFTAWARGVFLIGRYRGPLLRRLPSWIAHPGIAGVLGVAVPGLGLFATGHPRRAACALWMISLSIISIAVLWHSPGLWQWNEAAGNLALPPDTLELVFLAAGALGLLGALVWIVQALDGARLAGRRAGDDARPRGDLAALALLAAGIAFLMMFQPAELAGVLDRFGVAAHDEGLRIIPLNASTAAMRLDPSRPEYALHAVALNESLGRTDRAGALRRELSERWNAYGQSLRLTRTWIQP